MYETTIFQAELCLRSAKVGINLTDPVYRGIYRGTHHHESDLDDVLQRAVDVGCQKFMVTGSNLEESGKAVQLAQERRTYHYKLTRGKPSVDGDGTTSAGLCYATVGIHPCSAKEIDESSLGPDQMLRELEELAHEAKTAGHAVAFGEIGLDYDRLFLTGKDQQLRYFERQLEIAVRVQLPLFLHSRAASEDFERLLRPRLSQLPKSGLVHSFTGTMDEMRRLVAMGFHIGINGCSLRTEESLAVVEQIPLANLQIETDGPWVGYLCRTTFIGIIHTRSPFLTLMITLV